MRPVWRGIGLVLHTPACMALLSLPVCAWYGEWGGVADLLLTALLAVGVGQSMYWGARGGGEVGRYHAMLVAAASWLLVSLVSALPYWLAAATAARGTPWASLGHFINAFFEALSGLTSTGMTLLARPSALPHYLQWWRSLTEWVGGVGMILLMLSIMPMDQTALNLYRSEARDQKILPSVRSTVQAMWSIYVVYTLAGIALLWFAGAPVWRAINDGMSAIATGGFSVADKGLDGAPAALKIAFLPIMVVGATSFATHYRLLRARDWRGGLWGTGEQKLFWALLGLGAILVGLENWGLGDHVGALDSVLRWTEALTTSGFPGAGLLQWHSAARFWLILAMFCGGMAGSTAGGIKVLRVLTLYKGLQWSAAESAATTHQVVRHRLGNQVLDRRQADEHVRAAGILFALWSFTAVAGMLAMLQCVPSRMGFDAVLFDVISALGNVGLTAGLSPAHMSGGAKLTLCALMWLGRLEVVPVMVGLARLFTRR